MVLVRNGRICPLCRCNFDEEEIEFERQQSLSLRRLTIGEWGWVGLTTYIAIVDAHALRKKDETMSASWEKFIQTTRGRTICTAIWGVVTCHLWMSLIPEKNLLRLKIIIVDKKENAKRKKK